MVLLSGLTSSSIGVSEATAPRGETAVDESDAVVVVGAQHDEVGEEVRQADAEAGVPDDVAR